jgi:predicted AAA+ superfamily ATPase
LNKSDLARDVGIAPSTAAQWLSVLEATGLIVLLEPWFSNVTKRMIKAPKLYLTDTGLLTFLLGLSGNSLPTFAGLGSIWETYVFTELMRWRDTHHPEATLHYYRDKDGLEVDFVVNVGGHLYLFDAKLSELPKPSSNLARVEAQLKTTVSKGLISPTRQSFSLDNDVQVVSGFRLSQTLATAA